MKNRIFLSLSFVILSLASFEVISLLSGKIRSVESASDIRREIVVDMLRKVYMPNVRSFSERVDTLASDTDSICSEDNNYFELSDEVADVFQAYGLLEAVKFGSLSDPVFARDIEINPLFGDFNSCIIDQQVSTLATNPDGFVFDTSRKIFKGLSAIEYLVQDQDLNHSCSKRHPITRKWDDKAVEEKKNFRCKYLNLMVADLKKQSDLLVKEWDPQEGDLAGDIERNAMGNSSQDLLNQLSDGMYFLAKFLRDEKLALPLGFKEDCAESICASEFERSTLRLSLESVVANIDGFLSVFIGSSDVLNGDKKSFYLILEQIGRDDVASGIYQGLLEARQKAEELILNGVEFSDVEAEGFKNCFNNEESLMCDIFKPLAEANTIYKTEFYSVLNLRTPDGVVVDND